MKRGCGYYLPVFIELLARWDVVGRLEHKKATPRLPGSVRTRWGELVEGAGVVEKWTLEKRECEKRGIGQRQSG